MMKGLDALHTPDMVAGGYHSPTPTGMGNAYERLKELTRGRRVDGPVMRDFIAGLELPADMADRLTGMSPATYTGLSARLVEFLGE